MSNSNDPEAAKKNATYYGQDMNWMIWHGDADPIFPVNYTMNAYHHIFDILGVRSTVSRYIYYIVFTSIEKLLISFLTHCEIYISYFKTTVEN